MWVIASLSAGGTGSITILPPPALRAGSRGALAFDEAAGGGLAGGGEVEEVHAAGQHACID